MIERGSNLIIDWTQFNPIGQKGLLPVNFVIFNLVKKTNQVAIVHIQGIYIFYGMSKALHF